MALTAAVKQADDTKITYVFTHDDAVDATFTIYKNTPAPALRTSLDVIWRQADADHGGWTTWQDAETDIDAQLILLGFPV